MTAGWEYDGRRLGPLLAVLVTVLLVASVASTLLAAELPGLPLVGKAHRLLAFEEQRNLPAFAYALLCLLAAALAVAAARLTRVRSGWWWSWPWWLVAATTVGLALEDFLAVHDSLNVYVIDVMEAREAWTGPWGLTAAGVGVVTGLALAPFVVRLPGRTRLWLVAACALFAAGTLGAELAASIVYDRTGGPGLAYALVSTGEEALEMLAVVALVHAVALHLGHLCDGTRLRVRVV